MRALAARQVRARQAAEGLRRHLAELGLRGEAAAARTVVDYLDGRWSSR
jgi:hypothetical protein